MFPCCQFDLCDVRICAAVRLELPCPGNVAWSAEVHRTLANACEKAGVHPVRGDDLFTPTDILEDIWQSINAADFVVADITGRNPNVLYELGIAHTLAKPVIIISEQASDIPIDLATRRVILYEQSGEDWHAELEQKISASIAGVVRDYGFKTKQLETTPIIKPAAANEAPEPKGNKSKNRES